MRDKIRNERFGSFYLYLCEQALGKWKDLIDCRQLAFEVSDRVIMKNCYNRIKEIPVRTLIYDMHQWISGVNEKAAPQDDLYQIYNEKILGDDQYIKALLERYPELQRLLQLQIDQLLMYLLQILERLQKDLPEIEKWFCGGEKISGISAIDTGLSDLHEDGNTVSFLTFEDGRKIVYKPRSLEKEILYQELINKFYEESGLSSQKVSYMDRQKYGWEEFLEKKECTNEAETEKYFERMGIQLFVSYLLAASDLHAENIRACGEFPVIVDLETFPGMARIVDCTAAEDVIQNNISCSVLNTGMLPVSVWQNQIEGHLNAIHIPDKQKIKLKMPVVEHDKTENMCIGYQMAEVEMHDSIPVYKGIYVNPAEYQKAVERGFEKAFFAYLNRKEKYDDLIYELYSCRFRTVLRNTQLYSMVKSVSLHPDFMKSGEKRKNFIYETLSKYGNRTKQEQMLSYETDCLYNLDIPLFSGHGRQTDLSGGKKVCCPAYFPETALEVFEKRRKLLSEKDYQLQKIVLRMAFAELREAEHADMDDTTINNKEEIGLQERIERLIDEIAEYLLKTAVVMDDDISWMKMIGEKPIIYAPVGMDLYDGLPGIAVFLAQLQMEEKYAKYGEIYRKVIAKMFAYTKEEVKQSVCLPEGKCTGALIGEGSVILAYVWLYRITKEERFLEYAELHAGVLKVIWERDEQLDFLSGNAGAMYVLCILYEVTHKDEYVRLAEEIADWLWTKAACTPKGYGWILEEGGVPLTGMSHGNSGFMLAYTKLYEITGNGRYMDIIQKLHQYETANYDAEEGNWLDFRGQKDSADKELHTQSSWCHGAPGILLSRLKLAEIEGYPLAEEVQEDIRNAVNALIHAEYQNGMCLCHGRCGNLEIMEQVLEYMSEYGRMKECRNESEQGGMDSLETKWEDFKVKRNELLYEVIRLLEKKSGFRVSEWYHPGFMNGISGIGHCLFHRNPLY